MNNVQELKREFLEYMEIEKGSSLKTVSNYERYLDRFFAFAKISEPKEITEALLREYRLHLNRQLGIKVKGQNQATLKKNTQNWPLNFLYAFFLSGIQALTETRGEPVKTKRLPGEEVYEFDYYPEQSEKEPYRMVIKFLEKNGIYSIIIFEQKNEQPPNFQKDFGFDGTYEEGELFIITYDPQKPNQVTTIIDKGKFNTYSLEAFNQSFPENPGGGVYGDDYHDAHLEMMDVVFAHLADS
jgi:hypothetical protein